MSQNYQKKAAIPRTRRLNRENKPLLIGICAGIALFIVAAAAGGIFYFQEQKNMADQIIVEIITTPTPKATISPAPEH